MNDPNGLVWHKGKYHLFFQHNPFGREWGHMSWGHAVSEDLLSWKELPVAIAEDEDGVIFSGSAVSIGDEIVAIYTRVKDDIQSQCIATSADNGRTFVKHSANPVLDLKMKDFRDPKVFRYNEQWIMSVVKPHEFVVCFYSSTDLINWKFLSEFGKTGGVDGPWECPDLFPLKINDEEVWVLIISVNPGGINNGSSTQYFIGDFDGEKFTPRYSTEKPRWLDFGPDNYAGVTFDNEPNGKRILIGWMSRWGKDFVHPETSWTGAMTIPRELGLAEVEGEIVLTQQPICQPTYVIDEQVPTTGVVGLTGFVKVGYDADKKTIFINEFHAPFEPADNRVQLKLLVDNSSVELFTADGTRAITLAAFPEPGETRIFHAWRSP